ncbi:MAG: bifunctional metallophosphatase/5'-nucleotidase [Capsulimonadaceae bacterium]
MSITIHILHTNDFHNHLTDVQAARIAATRAELRDVLLLDSGDAVSAGNVGVRPGGEPILDLMSEAGYDAMTLGNREFHVAEALLKHKIRRAQFPILCANIRWREDRGDRLPVQPFIIKGLPCGVSIGVIGVTVPMVTTRMAARVVSAFVFDDPVDAVRELIPTIKPDVDMLMALTHIGIREDERLAAACPELDLIVGGHSHVMLSRPEVVGKVPIVQAGWFGHYLGHVTAEFDGHLLRDTIRGCLISLRG